MIPIILEENWSSRYSYQSQGMEMIEIEIYQSHSRGVAMCWNPPISHTLRTRAVIPQAWDFSYQGWIRILLQKCFSKLQTVSLASILLLYGPRALKKKNNLYTTITLSENSIKNSSWEQCNIMFIESIIEFISGQSPPMLQSNLSLFSFSSEFMPPLTSVN